MIIILLYYTGSKNKDRVRNASAPYMKKKLLKASASDTSTSSYVESVKKKKLLNASASDTSASSYVESVKKKKLLKASSIVTDQHLHMWTVHHQPLSLVIR